MKKQCLMLMATLFMFAFSCRKYNSDQPASQTKGLPQLAATILSNDGPANPMNPYDSIGYWHNQGCIYVIQHIQGGIDKSKNAYVRYTRDFIAQHFRLNIEDINPKFVDAIYADSANFYAPLLKKLALSQSGRTYLQGIYSALHSSQDSLGNFSFVSFKKSVIQIEQNVLNNHSLPGRDRALILKAASVGRYSAFLWSGNTNTFRMPKLLKMFLLVTATIASDVSALCGGDLLYAYLSDGEVWGPVLTSSMTGGLIYLYVP